jgi:hypothetical protein
MHVPLGGVIVELPFGSHSHSGNVNNILDFSFTMNTKPIVQSENFPRNLRYVQLFILYIGI